MRRLYFVSAFLLALVPLPAGAASAGKAHDLVVNAMNAMGGEARLRAITSIDYTATGYRQIVEQSDRPTGPYYIDEETIHVVRDYPQHHSRFEESHTAYGGSNFWSQQTKPSTLAYVINDDVAAFVNGAKFSYAGGYYLAFDSDQYGFSPERVLLEAAAAPDLRVLPDELLHGFTHHVVGYTWQGSPVKLYLNSYTSFPTAVEYVRSYPYHTFLNVWGDVTTRVTYEGWNIEPNGVRYPRQWTYEREGLPDTTLALTQLHFNPAIDESALTVPSDLYAKYHGHLRAVDAIPFGAGGSDPQEVAPGILQTSGGWNMEFVKQNDGIVVIEAPWSSGYSKSAFEAARKRYGLPIKAVITTSDAWPHIAGVRQAVAEGIPVYALDLNLPILKRLIAAPHTMQPDDLQRNPHAANFISVSKPMTLGTGENRIEIIPYRAETAERQMMVYFPAHKLLYTSDLFSPQPDGTWFLPEYIKEAADAVTREHLDVQTIFGMHYAPTPYQKLLDALKETAAAPNYHVANRYVLGGEGGWDYLTYDPAGKRLFISRSTHVMVVDPMTGTVVGDIPNTPGVHGIALAPELGKGFTSNGADGTLTVFDLQSLKAIATIKTDAKNPDGIVYDPSSKRVFTFNGQGNDATVVDAQTDSVVATIPLGGRPEFAVADGKGMVYDNIESTNEIVAIDAAKASVVARWPLGACQSPSGLSMDRANRRLFAACDGQMDVIDADSGKVIATLPTGAGTDATRFNPQSGLAFAPNGRDGTLTVVHEDSPAAFSVLQNAKSEMGARTMELDPQSGDVFLVTAKVQINPKATTFRERFHVVPGTFTLLVMEP